MNTINVKYFASLREKAGIESEELSFTGTYQDLYQMLSEKYGFNLPHTMVQVAVNDEFSLMNSKILPNSKVVFIPPVAGG